METRKRKISENEKIEDNLKKIKKLERKYNLLDYFCDEILVEILKHLDSESLFSLSDTCTHFQQLAKDKMFWVDVDFTAKHLTIGEIFRRLKFLSVLTQKLKIKGNCNDKKPKDHPFPARQSFKEMIKIIKDKCPLLEEMSFQYVWFDWVNSFEIKQFPQNLKKLVFINCCLPTHREPKIFSGIDKYLEHLEEIQVDYCNWFEVIDVMQFSKLKNLKKLSLKGCKRFQNCVPYLSLSCKFGFLALEVLDLRDTNIGDSELHCFNALKKLRELYLEEVHTNDPESDEEEDLITDTVFNDPIPSTSSQFSSGLQGSTPPSPRTILTISPSPHNSNTVTITRRLTPSGLSSEFGETSRLDSATQTDSLNSNSSETENLNESGESSKTSETPTTNATQSVNLENGKDSACVGESSISEKQSENTSDDTKESTNGESSDHKNESPANGENSNSNDSESGSTMHPPPSPASIPTIRIIAEPSNEQQNGNAPPLFRMINAVLRNNSPNHRLPTIVIRANLGAAQNNGAPWEVLNGDRRSDENIPRNLNENENSPPPINANRMYDRFLHFERTHRPCGILTPSGSISDRGLLGFGIPQTQLLNNVVFIRLQHRDPNTYLRKIIIRNYPNVTDVTLKHLENNAPSLEYLDITGTGISREAVEHFRTTKPDCTLITSYD